MPLPATLRLLLPGISPVRVLVIRPRIPIQQPVPPLSRLVELLPPCLEPHALRLLEHRHLRRELLLGLVVPVVAASGERRRVPEEVPLGGALVFLAAELLGPEANTVAGGGVAFVFGAVDGGEEGGDEGELGWMEEAWGGGGRVRFGSPAGGAGSVGGHSL